jgi:hypothetical protein
MQVNREIPAPIKEAHAPTGSQVFWRNVVTTCQLTAVQMMDDMVTINFQMDEIPDDIPVPVLTWYFWSRASILVQCEMAMSDGPMIRDLSRAAITAQDLKKQLDWLATCERASACDPAGEVATLRKLHADVVEALTLRPFHPRITDQTYGGNVPEPKRISAPAEERPRIEIAR